MSNLCSADLDLEFTQAAPALRAMCSDRPPARQVTRSSDQPAPVQREGVIYAGLSVRLAEGCMLALQLYCEHDGAGLDDDARR
jgi:hypothetical protein